MDQSLTKGRRAGRLESGWGWELIAAAALLALVIFAAFAPILKHGFVEWDDPENFQNNLDFRGLGWAQLRWAWTNILLGVYQPLSWIAFEAQYTAWGLDARGYHLTSLVLHTANAVALYALTRVLLTRIRPDGAREERRIWSLASGLVVALFAVHPLRVETVAWVSCQPYLPCALFSILAVLKYVRTCGEGRPKGLDLALVAFLFAAALLCKAAAVSLPVVLIILDIYPLKRLGGGPGRWWGREARHVWSEKVPFVLLSLFFMAIAVQAKHASRGLVSIGPDGPLAGLARACYGARFYLEKTVWPLGLAAYYPLPERRDWTAPAFLGSLLFGAILTAGFFLGRRRWPGLLASWAGYLAILAPSSGLIPVGSVIAADRYSYLAVMALVPAAAAGVGRLAITGGRSRRLALAAAGLGLLIGSGLLTWRQCQTWRTTETLWSQALINGAGGVARVHAALGAVLIRRGRLDEALTHFSEAVRLEPDFAEAQNNLGSLLLQLGKPNEALTHYREAARLQPENIVARYNLARVLARLGRFEEAAFHFAAAARLGPGPAPSLPPR
jgi:hypothetical protein